MNNFKNMLATYSEVPAVQNIIQDTQNTFKITYIMASVLKQKILIYTHKQDLF